ncbi:MAG: hypothetical protein ACRDHE_00100 [Ktedonobacterales bacterium]
MATGIMTQTEREVVELLSRRPTPDQIIAFHFSPDAAERFYELVDNEREHELAESEQRELDTYMYLEHFIRMMKIEARRQLEQQAG